MRVLSAFLLTIVVLGETSGQSYAATCQQLWVERNSIYKSGGYCFKTPRAIAHFGNAGCLHDSEGDVPLSAAQRRHIGSIVAEERAQGCGD